jgi:hypothetical protein
MTAPVRLAQTAPFSGAYAAVYNSTSKTLTQSGAGPYTPLPATVFDGIVPALNDSVLVSNGPSASNNGIYTCTQVGTTSVPFIFTRRSDLNSSTGFVGGVSFEVLDGATAGSNYKNTHWALTNLSTVTLDTTPTIWAPMRPKAALEIDLSLPPYNIQDYPSFQAWSTAGAVDYSIPLRQALWDYRLSAARLRLPISNGGQIVLPEPIDHYGFALLVGGGSDVSQLVSELSGGHICVAQNLPSAGTYDQGWPQYSATPVDSTTGAQAPSFYRNAHGDTNCQFYYNLTHAGVLHDSWANFEVCITLRWEDLTTQTPQSHILSCRGKRNSNDTGDVANPCYSIFQYSATSKVGASLRVTDTTKGAYGSVTHVGGGTSAVTGDATVKPTEDTPNLTLRVVTGGTIGVTGCVVQYAVDGVRFCAPVALGTANTIAIANDCNALAQPFSAKLDFGAGTLVAGDTYTLACTGVNQEITLLSDTVLVTGQNYEIILQYDGADVRLYVSKADGSTARDSGSSTTGAAATGVVLQRFWETTVLGDGQNANAIDSGADFGAVRAYLGAIRYKFASVTTPIGAAPTAMMSGVTGQKFFWRPNSTDIRFDPSGVGPRRWKAQTEIGRGSAWLVPRTPTTGLQMQGGGFEGLTFQNGNDPSQRGAGICSVAWRQRVFKDLKFSGGLTGWANYGPDFGSIDESLQFATGAGLAFTWAQGDLNAFGTWQFANASSACYAIIVAAAINATGTWFMNTEEFTTRCCMCLDQMETSVFSNIQIDAENQISLQCGRELIRICVLTGSSVDISGGAFVVESYSAIMQTGDPAQGNAGPIVLRNFDAVTKKYAPLASTPNALPFVRYVSGGYISSTPGSALAVPLCDTPNKVLNQGGVLGKALIPDAGPVPAWFLGTTQKLAAGTITANRNYTLSTTGMQLGDQYRIVVEAQTGGFTVQFTNGGPAGGNLLGTALAAGTDTTLQFRLNESFDLERV